MVFRDQRELDPGEVRAFARVLSVDPIEVASRSGAADPVGASLGQSVRSASPEGFQITREVITGIHERLDRLERMLELIVAKLDQLPR